MAHSQISLLCLGWLSISIKWRITTIRLPWSLKNTYQTCIASNRSQFELNSQVNKRCVLRTGQLMTTDVLKPWGEPYGKTATSPTHYPTTTTNNLFKNHVSINYCHVFYSKTKIFSCRVAICYGVWMIAWTQDLERHVPPCLLSPWSWRPLVSTLLI